MALQPNLTGPTAGSANAFAVFKKCESTLNKTWIFAAGSGTIATATPVGFNESTGNAVKWMAPDPTVLVVDIDGDTGGTWGLTINGIVIANTVFAFNAAAAVVANTIKAQTGVVASVTLADEVYTITFDDEPEIKVLPVVTGDVTQLTGPGTPTAVATAGTATLGSHLIKGIVWPEPIVLNATGEIGGVVMVNGNVDIAELVATVDVGDVTALKAACRTELLPRGLNVQNLSQVR